MAIFSEKDFLSRYEEIRILSENKKGIVKFVTDKTNGEKRVLKLVYGLHSDVYSQLKNLMHLGLPKIYDLFDLKDKYYIVQEYIKGFTLYEKLLDSKLFLPKDVKKYILELCDILDYLHKQEPPIIHRDIKPSNIMFSNDERLVLIDFDASRLTKDFAEKDTMLIVTKGYAPPEQYGFAQTDPRSDIYAIGILIAELLSGEVPQINQINISYGKFSKIIKKCIEIDPNKRYQNIGELKKEIIQLDKPIKLKFILGSVLIVLFGALAVLFGNRFINTPSSVNFQNNTIESVNEADIIPNLKEFYDKDTYPYELLSTPYIDKELKELLGTRYDYFTECLDNVTVYYDEKNNAYIMEGGVTGLYTIMEAFIEIRQNGKIYIAYLDDDLVYYTNDENEVSIIHEGYLYDWVESRLRNIVFKNAPEPTFINGNYVSSLNNALTMAFYEGGLATFEGIATYGANAYDVSGQLGIIENYALFEDEDGQKLHFYFSGNNIVVFEEGNFGGLNVTFRGNYIKK